MLPAEDSLVQSVVWRIDGEVVDPSTSWICTSYLNRRQERNITPECRLHPISFSMAKDVLLEIISDWYATLIEDEKGTAPEEDDLWTSEFLRQSGYPSLADLWKKSEHAVARLMVEYQTELLELIYLPEHGWKDHDFFVHEIDRAQVTDEAVIFSGLCIEYPDLNKRRLENLVTTLSNPDHYKEVLLGALEALRNGRSKAVSAMQTVEGLLDHPVPAVVASARHTLTELQAWREKTS